MKTYIDFGVSYPNETFVDKINKKLWHDSRVYLIDDFYDEVDQNKPILTTVDSLLDHG